MATKEIKRLYNMEDELMQTRAQTKCSLLEEDLALFTPKFPWLDETWKDGYQTDINTAKAYELDSEVVSHIKVLTEDVTASMAEGMTALFILDKYAKVAYRTEPAKQRVFGQDKWEKARSDQQKMINALEHAYSFANRAPYKTDLLAKGYTLVEIAALQTLAQNINLKDGLQEAAKSERPVTTQQRIQVNNVVWQRDQLLAVCAEVVFINDPARQAQYQLYPPGSGAASTTVIVHVTHLALPLKEVTVELTNTELTPQQTDENGNAVFSSVNMPDAVDVRAESADFGIKEENGKPVIEGEENVIEVVM